MTARGYSITHLLIGLVLLSVNLGSRAQESCEAARIVNGLDLEISCLIVQNDIFGLTLNSVDPSKLTWRFNGAVNAPSCTADTSRCATVSADLSLAINRISINGEPHQIELAPAPDLGPLHWRYRNHTKLALETTTPALSTSGLEQVRLFMQQVVETQVQVPGAVLGLAQGNSIVFMEAFGERNADTGEKLTIENLLHIGSTNKMITSFMIAALVDEGVLQWDTRAVDIYPDFLTSDSAASASITIRQLLDMTSGLPRDAEVETSEPARALFDRLSEQTLISTPGTNYQYSNLSSSLAGYLAVLANTKAKTGQITEADLNNLHGGYTDLLKSKVLTPIGMNSSTLSANEALATGRLSEAHERVNNKFSVSPSIDNDPDNIAPAGGLKSTISDMLGYIITDMLQGVSPTGARVVSATNVAERQKLSTGPANASEYGLSIEVVELANGINYIGHSGSFGNFNSVMGFFPQKQLAFVLLTNGESAEALELTGTQQNSLVERLSQLLN